ncbi:Trichohyalin [Quillaja saponaria]|uniref:Trichohyalin n=1 Tax=Quillaja saponaria TaxID=32244 RepID=A0AAD7L5R3_QUISA|nr:Trichohyalin [Quillaja saponaria]
MAEDYGFKQDEMTINENLGYPKAHAKLCRDRCASPYNHGPPFTFTPYSLQQDEAMRARGFDQMFPIMDPKAKLTAKPKIFLSLLWKQLNHLGNAGFDPTVIRVDPYGNVLYYHADTASPLAWDIDHWFPCSRGGLTVPSNLRILQWQASKKKHNKLEFLIPWWDFQLGISVNQFLSIFASSNSDFRHRAFSFLFSEAENEELNASQIVDSHSFPQHFIESKEQVGLAPAAIVRSRMESFDTSSVLGQMNYNWNPRPMSPAIAERKMKSSFVKENENPNLVTNPYQAIVMARDSLKQREETSNMQAELQKLGGEMKEMKLRNEEEKFIIQDLESTLIKRRRKAEKCRRLAEAQSSYRNTLEKMIRDTMHQSVIYKEQVRLNQAATNALMARLQTQKAICDSAEKELQRRYKQRDEIEKQIRPEWEQARKRSRMDDTLFEERDDKPVLYLPGIRPRTPLHKELRLFLEEEQKASRAGLSPNKDQKREDIEEEHNNAIVALEDENPIEYKLQKLEINEQKKYEIPFPVRQQPELKDDESMKQRGKGNVEKWLQMLLENTQEEMDQEGTNENKTSRIDEIIKKLNQKYPQKEGKVSQNPDFQDEKKEMQLIQQKNSLVGKEEKIETEAGKSVAQTENRNAREAVSVKGFQGLEKREARKVVRSESARAFRRIPSSPNLILGMRKGVDCIMKKPMVSGDDDLAEDATANSFIKTIKKTVKI